MLNTLMVGHLGVLVVGPAAATTEAGDIDGEPPDLHCDNEVGSAKKMLVVISDPGGAGPGLPLLAPSHRPHS
jgi:hypothetical protein